MLNRKLLVKVKKLFLFLANICVILIFFFPLAWIISLSLKDQSQIFEYPPRLIPRKVSLENYLWVIQNGKIFIYISNSVKIIILTVIGTLLLSIPAAFSLSRHRIGKSNIVLIGLLVFQMISPLVIAIPLYRYFLSLNLIDTHFGVIIVYIALQGAFSCWIIRGFLNTVPIELDEAAKIDGCTDLQILIKILLPLSLPGIASSVILVAINSWAQFIIPFILLDRDILYPVAVGILSFQTTTTVLTYHLLAAASVLAILPALLIFLTLQKFIIHALMAGAVKG